MIRRKPNLPPELKQPYKPFRLSSGGILSKKEEAEIRRKARREIEAYELAERIGRSRYFIAPGVTDVEVAAALERNLDGSIRFLKMDPCS